MPPLSPSPVVGSASMEHQLLELAAKVPKGYVLMPIKPSRPMLRGMSAATWLTDGSALEMERRWNGALDGWRKSKRGRAIAAATEQGTTS